MALNVNSHVERLYRFQPFHADSAELVQEQADPTERGFDSVALDAVLRAVEDPGVRLVVLTGDAGHGKTHLCARVLMASGLAPLEAAALLNADADGRAAIVHTPIRKRPLRIVKDLSEVTVERATGLLHELLHLDEGTVSLVCVNEGRLRRTVASSEDHELRVLIETLRRGLQVGTTASSDRSVHVINLNYQSVAPNARTGLVDWAIKTWAVDGRRWRTCDTCDARPICPVYTNHVELADAERGSRRRDAVRALFATAERTGVVVTIRQALATISFALTGGLRCQDVHLRWSQGPDRQDWQYGHLFHQAIFGDGLTPSERARVPVVNGFRRLDPGHYALRAVDDTVESEGDEARFQPPLPLAQGPSPKSRRDAKNQGESLRELLTFLRRRSFFEDAQEPDLAERMGLRAGALFDQAADGRLDGAIGVAARDDLLRGLGAVQGLRRSANPPDFLVLDPAFVNYRNRAAIVARKIQSRNVEVVGQVQFWERRGGDDPPELQRSVDWQNRTAYLCIEDSVAIPLDLLRFELLHRWAAGLSARVEHESVLRHLNGSLAQLVPHGGPSDEIIVLTGQDRRSLMIDVGELVRSGDD